MEAIDPIEKHLLLEGIFLRYGYDFRGYAGASLERRLGALLRHSGCSDVMALLTLILRDKEAFWRLLPHFTVTTTEFFRDPSFFLALKREVFPVLRTYSSLRVWVAGCSTGEELFSLLVLLKEEGLLTKTTVYATDINPAVLERAKEGIFDMPAVQTFTRRYLAAGGAGNPSDHYSAHYGKARFDPALLHNVVFSLHNLATDHVFAEMHLILCRNVFIYFSRPLQDRAFQLFQDSLVHRGFLGIGSKESMLSSPTQGVFQELGNGENIFQKKPALDFLPRVSEGA